MNIKLIFKSLVVISMAAYVTWFCLPFFDVYLYPSDIAEMLTWTGYGGTINTGGTIPYIWLAAYGVVSIGLIYFHPWARTAFVALTVLAVVITPFYGLIIQSSYEGFFTYIMTLSDGAIIAMAYLTIIKDEFKSTA